MIDETVRLYSKEQRSPVDSIAPQHIKIHDNLERFGNWNRERYQQGFCYSVEHRFESNVREVKRATITLPPDPMLAKLERVILTLPEQHSETIIQFYCKRLALKTICWSQALRYEDFGNWMYDCREMVRIRTGGQDAEKPVRTVA